MDSFKAKRDVEKKYPAFVEETNGMSVSDLNARINKLVKDTDQIQTAMDENQKINEAKELLKELKGPYTDGIKENKLKVKYLIEMIKEKGGQ